MSSEEMKDPRYKMLQAELKGVNARLDALMNIGQPKPFVLDIKTLSKASTFELTEVSCIGADLIQISTDGDQTDVSYKIIQMDGGVSLEMEAAESPHILGPIVELLITNDTAEVGKAIRIARYQGSQAALGAIKHGTAKAAAVMASGRMFYAEIEEYTSGAPGYFETDQAMGVLPTLSFVGTPAVLHLRIHTIKWQITPTAGETYELYLLERASENDEQQESDIIFDSDAGMVGGKVYIQVEGGSPAKLPIDVKLDDAGKIWYMVDWSGAPGNSSGYIKVYGEVLG